MSLEKDGLPPSLETSIPQEIFKAEVRSWAERIGRHHLASDEA